MNAKGLAYVKKRLLDCPDMESLRRVWDSLGNEYQNNREIYALKEKLKNQHARSPDA